MLKKFLLCSALLLSTGLAGCTDKATAKEPANDTSRAEVIKSIPEITKTDVEKAQQQWAEGLIAIGQASLTNKDEAQKKAEKVLDTLYDYTNSTVLFKPTKASEVPFRSTREDALSYFVGGDIKEDTGFALEPWTDVRFENHDMILSGDHAIASGEYYFTSGATKEEVKVEYTFGYTQDKAGNLRINVHHSSMPYH